MVSQAFRRLTSRISFLCTFFVKEVCDPSVATSLRKLRIRHDHFRARTEEYIFQGFHGSKKTKRQTSPLHTRWWPLHTSVASVSCDRKTYCRRYPQMEMSVGDFMD